MVVLRSLALLGLVACAARAPRFPGPLGPVGRGEGVGDPAAALRPLEEVQPRSSLRDAVREAATYYLSHRPPGVPDDCVGFVWASFARAGVRLRGSSADLWDRARALGTTHHRRLPRPGDVAFFDDTYDRNRNGQADDPLTHVAIVLDVDPSGTLRLAHGGTGKGRATMVMNLHQPDVRHDADGNELNSWLRRQRDDDPRGTRYLSGQLWRGFAWFPGAEPDLAAVSDRHDPGAGLASPGSGAIVLCPARASPEALDGNPGMDACSQRTNISSRTSSTR